MKFDFTKYNFIYTADFETSTPLWYDKKYQKDNYGIDVKDTDEVARIWAWDICFISKNRYAHKTGNTMEGFINTISHFPLKSVICFHNLAFDGSYLISWLLNNDFECVLDTPSKNKTFQTCISDMGNHYAYQIYFDENHSVVIMDSLKYITASVKEIAKMYNLPIVKGECEYNRYRFIGDEISSEDLSYIRNDTEIMARAIAINIEHGQIKFTQAGNAKNEFRKTFSKNDYDFYFPELSANEDSYMRKSYVGGFTFVNPKYQGKDLGNMVSLDYNSMYPSQMLYKPMPYGTPIFGRGKFGDEKIPSKYDICIQHFACRFILKENHIPMIATKKLYITQPDVYMKSSEGKQIELTLSSPDLELFFENYYVDDIEYIDYYAFCSKEGEFVDKQNCIGMSNDDIIKQSGIGSLYYNYFLKWRYIKEHAEKGSTERAIAKRMQNALYGAEACNPYRSQNVPYLDDNRILKYKTYPAADGKPMYLPAAIFTTAWSRYAIINAILDNIDRFVYCDTDSLYLLGHEVPNIPVHDSLYGYFKIEHIIDRARFLGPKRYIYYARTPESERYEWEVACCGASDTIKEQMNWDNFKSDEIFDGKLTMKTVKGGKHLVETTYKLMSKH